MKRISKIDTAERDLERLLVTHAEVGLPELVLVKLLRDYATTIERIGYVPRTWDSISYPEAQFQTGQKP